AGDHAMLTLIKSLPIHRAGRPPSEGAQLTLGDIVSSPFRACVKYFTLLKKCGVADVFFAGAGRGTTWMPCVRRLHHLTIAPHSPPSGRRRARRASPT